MKRFILFILLSSTAIAAHSQSRLDSLMTERNKVYLRYCEHKDTLTVNTWLNIFKLNKYLQQIVIYDSLINSEILSNYAKNNKDLTVIQSKIENLINEKKDLNRRLSEAGLVYENSGNNLTIAIFTGSAITVLFVVFLILYLLTLNKIKKKNFLIKDYHTKLYSAKAEIELMQKDQIEMATEINMHKTGFDDEIGKIMAKFNILSDEKVLLENQIIEIKKAYDREVEKRNLAEDKLHSLENPEIKSFEEVNHNIIPDEENALTKDIHLLKIELEREKLIRISIEKDLNELLQKLREQYP